MEQTQEQKFRSKNEAKLKILEQLIDNAALYDQICTIFSRDEIRFPNYHKQKNITERNRKIRQDYESDSEITTKELAKKYNLATSTIYKLMEKKIN